MNDARPSIRSIRSRIDRSTIFAVGTTAVSVACIAGSWLLTTVSISVPTVVVTIFLVLALVVSYRFPIHVRVNTKIYIGSAVLYLIAVLLPSALAATVAALGVFVGEVSVQQRTKNRLRDLITSAARWGIIGLSGSLVAHLPTITGDTHVLPLVAAGVVLWSGDLLTSLIVHVSKTGERPPLVFTAMVKQGGLVEALQYLVGLTAALEVPHRLWTLGVFVLWIALIYDTFKHSQKVRQETSLMLDTVVDAIDKRNPYMGGHSIRVTELTVTLLRELNNRGPEAEIIVAAARVRDIGMIAIPDSVVLKPGALTAAEREVMQTHTKIGADLLQPYGDFARSTTIVRHHHEAWNGSGYPAGLRGTEIPFGARVLAVADAYDAMTSERPYRPAMSLQQAVSVLREGRGQQWDATIVDAFLSTIAHDLQPADREPLQTVLDGSALRGPG